MFEHHLALNDNFAAHFHRSHVFHLEFGCEHLHPHLNRRGRSRIIDLQRDPSICFFEEVDVVQAVVESSVSTRFNVLEPTYCQEA